MVLLKLSYRLTLLDIPVEPILLPLTFNFPNRGVVQRSCQAEQFSTQPWLHYSASDDVILCYVCITAIKIKRQRRAMAIFLYYLLVLKTVKVVQILAFKGQQTRATHEMALHWCCSWSIMYIVNLMLQKSLCAWYLYPLVCVKSSTFYNKAVNCISCVYIFKIFLEHMSPDTHRRLELLSWNVPCTLKLYSDF